MATKKSAKKRKVSSGRPSGSKAKFKGIVEAIPAIISRHKRYTAQTKIVADLMKKFGMVRPNTDFNQKVSSLLLHSRNTKKSIVSTSVEGERGHYYGLPEMAGKNGKPKPQFAPKLKKAKA